jgi:glucose/arabinose dehydrogenase
MHIRRHTTIAFTVAVALALASAGCDDDDDAERTTTATRSAARAVAATGTPSVTADSTAGPETRPPPPPTAIPQPVTAGGYQAVRAFPQADFSRMVALVPIPGDTSHAVVLTQQDGIIYRISLTDDSQEPTVFLDLSDTIIDDPGNEEGLLGLAFSPGYASDRRFFVAYSAGGPRRNTVARYTAPADVADPASGRVILEVEDFAANHNGGALAFGQDGYLYVAIGDGGGAGDPQGNGQNLNALLGKILRLDVSGDAYTTPADNPFAGSGRAEIWAYGLRNPWRFSVDRQTGAIWAGDVGQGTWEEVDLIERGGNYGWDTTEGPDCFNVEGCDRTGLIAPRAAYRTRQDGACAVTG